MDFKKVLAKFQEEVSKVTLSGLKEATETIDKWDDTALAALNAVFPGNPGIMALREIEPRAVKIILAAIAEAENSGYPGEEKKNIAGKLLMCSPDFPEVRLEEVNVKIQSVFDVVKGIKGMVK